MTDTPKDEAPGEASLSVFDLIAQLQTERAQYERVLQMLMIAEKALQSIGGPSFGTELCNSDEENNEILATHHFSNQTTARKALAKIEELKK